MKKTTKQIIRGLGFDGLSFAQRALVCWVALSLMLLVSCNYEHSAWYALPVLFVNFAASVLTMRKFIPKKFWKNEKD